MKIDEKNFSIIKKASDITGTEYEILWVDAENVEGYIFSDTMLDIIDDLLLEVDRLKEEYEDLITDRNENYEPKKFDPYKEYGISEDDFH